MQRRGVPSSGRRSGGPTGATRAGGLRAVSRITRWTVVGALGLTGVLSAVASATFSGHGGSSDRHVTAGAANTGTQSATVALPPTSSGGVLAPPAAPPASAVGGGQATSGGS